MTDVEEALELLGKKWWIMSKREKTVLVVWVSAFVLAPVAARAAALLS